MAVDSDSNAGAGRGVFGRKIKVGVCVMEKKAFSAPMAQILERLEAFGEFEIIIFGDKVILEDPVESWPLCDCLIAFYSSGYPLAKAEAYAALRKPFLVNELQPQHLLHDRRKVYECLEMFDIPVPRYALVNRESRYQEVGYFVEEEDFIEVHGERFWKPFVEKPVHGDDHSIMIYYPSSAGGGMKELFRKVGNRSSEFHPEVRRVRREGSYIYEEFMPTGGTDVKVYTVGPEYAHAEARKSPVVDGVVMRNHDGKEVRYPVLLTPTEKEMAREVCIAFRQMVCGFDLLRFGGCSYVCDVNGWSFVKNSYKYYDDAACVLRKMFLDAKAPHLSSTIPPTLPWKVKEPVQPSEGLTRQGSGIIGTFGQAEELPCVIAVMRHGDRTPKQKVTLKVTEDKLLNSMLKYNGGKPRSETKLKTAVEATGFHGTTIVAMEYMDGFVLAVDSRASNENVIMKKRNKEDEIPRLKVRDYWQKQFHINYHAMGIMVGDAQNSKKMREAMEDGCRDMVHISMVVDHAVKYINENIDKLKPYGIIICGSGLEDVPCSLHAVFIKEW